MTLENPDPLARVILDAAEELVVAAMQARQAGYRVDVIPGSCSSSAMPLTEVQVWERVL